jgi:hypothetical protein
MFAAARTGPSQRWTANLLVIFFISTLCILAGCDGSGNRSGDGGNPSSHPAPTLTSLSPTSATAGGATFTLTANGSGFISASAVYWNGESRSTTFVSSTQLTAAISATDVANAGTAQVTVVNPAPGGGTSAAVAFTISSAAAPPALTGLDPATVEAGRPAFDLVVSGTGFVQGATVYWNGAARVTTFISATQVKAAIFPADVENPTNAVVTVENPPPGGGTSNSLTFVVTAPSARAMPLPISVAPDGAPPNGPSINGGMGMFGRVAIFASKASNLVPGDTNDAWDVFLRDTCMDLFTVGLLDGCTPVTVRLSQAPDGSQADGDSGVTAGSPNGPVVVNFSGRYVAFVSSATNLVAGDTNGVDDVFLVDTCFDTWGRPVAGCTRMIVRVSLRSDGSQSTGRAHSPAIGDTGGDVAFVSADPAIVADDGNGVDDVFLRATCLGSSAGCTPGTQRISVAQGPGDADAPSGSPAFTGRYVAFTSVATNLVAGDTNAVADVFIRDTCIEAEAGCTPSTERISLGNGDVQANGPSAEPLVGLPMSSMSGYDYHGRFVVFTSTATNLVAGDSNGVADVFMRDTCRGRSSCTPSTQRVSLTSQGQQIFGAPSKQPGHMRWDGEVVLFVTAADGVVPGDNNGVEDVFMRGVCHGTATCDSSADRISAGEGGLQGNGASAQPRGNHDAWAGPTWATFFSTSSNFWPGNVPDPYYGAIYRTTTH